MGEKGAKLTDVAGKQAEMLVEKIASIGDISSKKMFGGYGVFCRGKMFALVNSQGIIHFKVGDLNREDFETVNAEKHGRMPYYALPDKIFQDDSELMNWADKAIKIAEQ